jgi:hypothetical protein
LQQPSDNKIEDARGDTNILALQKTNIVPEVRDYHNILSADVNKVNNKIQLTIDLAGDANQNKGYGTVYLWLIYYTAADEASIVGKEDLLYAVIIPNFGAGSNFGNIKKGWYLAIFNHTDNSYSIPLSRISDMPKNKVQVFFEADFIGNSSSSFNYIVSAMIRVKSTFLDKPPDYLVILLLITIIHFGNNGLDNNNKNNEDKSWKDIMCLTLQSTFLLITICLPKMTPSSFSHKMFCINKSMYRFAYLDASNFP